MLRGVEGISFVQFDDRDVVRHNLVQRIVKAYERYNEAVGAGRQLTLETDRTSRRNGSRYMSASDDHIVLFRRAPAELNRRSLERFARTLRGEVANGAGFTCLITGDRELRRLNRDFLGKDYPTDVLSFPRTASRPSVEPRSAKSPSPPPAPARKPPHSATLSKNEIRILMLHGLLHLLGMDHETDTGQMRRAEGRWRRRLALPAGLIERTTRPSPSPSPPRERGSAYDRSPHHS